MRSNLILDARDNKSLLKNLKFCKRFQKDYKISAKFLYKKKDQNILQL